MFVQVEQTSFTVFSNRFVWVWNQEIIGFGVRSLKCLLRPIDRARVEHSGSPRKNAQQEHGGSRSGNDKHDYAYSSQIASSGRVIIFSASFRSLYI